MVKPRWPDVTGAGDFGGQLGVPITTYCDTHKLTLPERLELFVQVCGGVQHAQNQNLEVKVTTIFLQLQQVADSDLPTSLYSKRVTVPAVRLIQLVYGLGVKKIELRVRGEVPLNDQ
jgi:hypothetical protein